MRSAISKAVLAEFIGTAALLCAVIGSGIMAEHLSAGNNGVALLANTLATGFMLYVLIETLGPISGAHFNPVVTLVMAFSGQAGTPMRWPTSVLYITVQLAGALLGAWLANVMFDLSAFQVSTKLRGGLGQWLAEAIATAGLLFTILRAPPGKAGALVACHIGAAYWFTASTSFANPAAVLGRMFSDSFAGIAPASALGFVIAQSMGAGLGTWLAKHLGPTPEPA